MTEHLQKISFSEAIEQNKKLTFPVKKSNKSRAIGKLRYWWCWLIAALLLLLVALPVMIFLMVVNKRLWLYPFCLWGARTWLKACGAKVKVKGLENLEEGKGYVFASNHRSYLDTATMFGFMGRRIGLVAKKELLKVPVFGQGMGFVNIIAIDRSNAERAMESMAKAKKVIDNGYSFGVFAEGTRAYPGDLLPFKKGAFHLALQTDAPIAPVAIRNTDWMMGKKTGVLFPGTIEVIIMPPIETAGLTTEDIPELIKKTREQIAEELSKQ